jgi:nucleoside-diphosphate-sugar epimerase
MTVVPLVRQAAARETWREQCAVVDAVIHLAAPTDGIDADAVLAALENTRVLFGALPDRPLSFVFAGSMAVFEPPRDDAAVDERSAVFAGDSLDRQDAYTRMKSAQEDLVRTACRARGDRLTIVRPSNVWDAERWLQSCVGPKLGPIWLVVAPARPLRLVHRINCATAFVEALKSGSGAPTELNVDDGANISAWGFATRVVGWRRRGYVPLPVAGWLFDAVSSAAAFALGMLAPRRKVPGLLIAERRASRFGAWWIDTRAIREKLGWRPNLAYYDVAASVR